MHRIWSWLGCFGLILLAILFVLGVTEAIKYVSPLERTLVLIAAVLAAAAVAFLRDWIKNGAASAPHKSEPADEPTKQERLDSFPQTTPQPIHDALLAARRQIVD